MSFCSAPVTTKKLKRPSKIKREGPSFASSSRVAAVVKKRKQPASEPPRSKIVVKKRVDANEFNIFHIDSIISSQLKENIAMLPSFERDLKNALWITINGSSKDKIMAKPRTVSLRRKIQDLESTFELSYYLLKTSDILDRYRKIVESETSRSFVCIDRGESDRETAEREILTARYIKIAREYIEIENYKSQPEKLKCPECNNTDMRRASEEETTFVCTECATEVQILDDTPSFKDTDRVNMCRRYAYTCRGHFSGAVKKYQGKQNTDRSIIHSVVEVLRDEMAFHNLTPDTVTKTNLYMFLSERGLSDHYDDLNLLHHIISGKPCPDISEYEAQLFEDFDKQDKSLDEVAAEDPADTRINALNVYYKLYKLLQRQGCPCRKDDFHILKTKIKEDEHDEKMKKAWKRLDWDWIETF